MNLHSPIVAMLWENWRLSRVEAVQRTALGLVAGAAALTFAKGGALYAFWILILAHAFFWFSIAKLNGGKLADGYKPGFPLYLLYSRPVSTPLFVGVTMAYDAVSCVALYLASAALLGFAFGQPLPLFSVTVCLAAYHLVCVCIQWSTRSRVVQWTASIVIATPFFFWLKARVVLPLAVEFSLVENALLVLIGVVSFGVTVAGVARQRRGDAVASEPRKAGAAGLGGYPDWLVNLFRFRCPTSSATRAQLWFELKSSGLPVLTLGFVVAIAIFLLFALSIPFAPVRPAAVVATMFSVPVALFAFGGNAFGVRRKQGRAYTSAFHATQPYGTAQMAGLQIFVRTACVLVAMSAIGLSLWNASALMSSWGEWLADGKKDALPGLLELRQKFGAAFAGLSGYAYAAQAFVASIAVATVVAWLAAREALRARYPRLTLALQLLPIAWSLAMILLALALGQGLDLAPLVRTIFIASFWIFGAAMVTATIYFLWSGLARRVLTIRYACGALAMSVAFGAAWRAGIPAGDVVGILWLVLLILMASVVAPWALSRVRHV